MTDVVDLMIRLKRAELERDGIELERDDARAALARVEAAVSTWPPGPRKGDVLRSIAGEGK